ncbi:MAG TPA: hypothetical protein VLF87_01125 [Patescibacteria group bacterium]|nr:hypothetical protein [Patescibacteria group bacterium]
MSDTEFGRNFTLRNPKGAVDALHPKSEDIFARVDAQKVAREAANHKRARRIGASVLVGLIAAGSGVAGWIGRGRFDSDSAANPRPAATAPGLKGKGVDPGLDDSPQTDTYVVQPGDTEWGIAGKVVRNTGSGDIREETDTIEHELGTASLQGGERPQLPVTADVDPTQPGIQLDKK